VSRRPVPEPSPPEILFSEAVIAARIAQMAKDIAAAPVRPAIAMPILVGGFVFAADLVRALSREGVATEIEMLWLRSYGDKRVASAVSMIAGPSEDIIAGRDVLVIDGILDFGRTLKKATQLILAAGAASVQVAVIIDKQRSDAVAKADFVGFPVGPDFIVGYGTDDAGKYRSLPYIAKMP
jgi:hypoxanthine phosphoribosyltransferase